MQSLFATDGRNIVSNVEIEDIRKKKNNYFIAQKGGQESLLSTDADITIYGGMRGGGKSVGILLDGMYDINRNNFRAVVLRNEIGDLSDLIDTSYSLYEDFGIYNRSKNDMTWNFNKGGFLKFEYFAGSMEDFRTRFRGKQFAYIAVDEITQMAYEKFKFLITCNRNAYSFRNRFIGTCNPDPDSWVAKFIDWWIGEDGLPIPDRDGVVRYCFMDGDDVGSVYWGSTRKEVYLQAKDIIDRYYKPEYSIYGKPEELFVKSVCFIEGKLADNKKLLESDPAYLANLANQSEEQRARDLDGNWKFKVAGNDLIKLNHMEAFFGNAEQKGDGIRRASCDVAFDGGDNLVMWLLVGWHIQDVFVSRTDSYRSMMLIKQKLEEWGVDETNFTYDVSGIGQGLKGFFPRAVPFNNREAPINCLKGTYDSVKSQCAFLLAEKIIAGEISINPDLLERKYSGIGYSQVPLRQILMKERKIIRPDNDRADFGRCLIRKNVMKRLIGHSPDFIEALLMVMIFTLKHKKHLFKGLGLL